MKNFGELSAAFHDFQYDIRATWFWDFHGIVLAVVKIDAIFVMRFAHLARQRSPFDADAKTSAHHIQPFSQPCSQTLQVDVAH